LENYILNSNVTAGQPTRWYLRALWASSKAPDTKWDTVSLFQKIAESFPLLEGYDPKECPTFPEV
jgi:hypothetical protein